MSGKTIQKSKGADPIPAEYAKPRWVKYDRGPFLEPYVDFASMFRMERPSIDYLKEATPYP